MYMCGGWGDKHVHFSVRPVLSASKSRFPIGLAVWSHDYLPFQASSSSRM